jgi:hypothetical protein
MPIAPRFTSQTPPPTDENTVDTSKLDARLLRQIEAGQVPISLFVRSTGELTPQQLEELKELGLQVNPIAGNINTARLQTLEHLAKISRKPYIHSMQGSQRLYPN